MEQLYPESEATTAPTQIPPGRFYPTYKESWLVLGWFLLVSMVTFGVFFAAARLGGVPHHYSLLVSMMAGDAAKGLVVVFLTLYIGKQQVLPLSLTARQERPGVYAAVLIIAGAQMLLRSLLHELELPTWGLDTMLAHMLEFPVAASFTICVAAPVLEELLFRGLVLPGLERNYGSTKAILQSSLVFGVFHLNPAQALSAFLLGVLLGWVYVRTRSLAACIWLHFLNNAVAWGLGWVPALRHYNSLADLLPADWRATAVIAVLILCLGLGITVLARLTKSAPLAAEDVSVMT